mmetsp:Transcript_4300/g.11150  ORF Transcript_4300/g.11150 Transcript_4300/m.11150 type:complete len:236 (-) Transcript_4300:354-1061(-)
MRSSRLCVGSCTSSERLPLRTASAHWRRRHRSASSSRRSSSPCSQTFRRRWMHPMLTRRNNAHCSRATTSCVRSCWWLPTAMKSVPCTMQPSSRRRSSRHSSLMRASSSAKSSWPLRRSGWSPSRSMVPRSRASCAPSSPHMQASTSRSPNRSQSRQRLSRGSETTYPRVRSVSRSLRSRTRSCTHALHALRHRRRGLSSSAGACRRRDDASALQRAARRSTTTMLLGPTLREPR